MKYILLSIYFCCFSLAQATSLTDLMQKGQYSRAYYTALKQQDFITASEAAVLHHEFHSPQHTIWIDRAISAGKQAVQSSSNKAEALFHLGSAFGLKASISGLSLKALQHSYQSRTYYEKSLQLRPHSAKTKIALAYWHASAYAKAGVISGGNPNTALQLSTKALNTKSKKSVYILIYAAQTQLELKNKKQAQALFQKSLSYPAKSAADRALQKQAQRALKQLK